MEGLIDFVLEDGAGFQICRAMLYAVGHSRCIYIFSAVEQELNRHSDSEISI